MLEAKLLHGESITVTGRTLAGRSGGRKETRISRSCASSIPRSKPTGGLVILKGNIAPEGASSK